MHFKGTFAEQILTELIPNVQKGFMLQITFPMKV